MGRYSIPLDEQETIIQFTRDQKFATIYTSDSTMITKLDKLCETAPDNYKLEKSETIDGGLVSNFYRLEDKSLISFRSKKVTLNLSDEQRKVLSDRMREMQNFQSTE